MTLAMLLLPSSVSSAAQGLLPVLPLPSWWAAGNQSATLTASTFAFTAAAGSEDADGVLAGALERYYPLTFAHTHHSAATDRSGQQHLGMLATVADPSAPLELGANESYILTIRPSGAAHASAGGAPPDAPPRRTSSSAPATKAGSPRDIRSANACLRLSTTRCAARAGLAEARGISPAAR